jgi:poly(3-hydroxybutyrate) depolymerase
MFFASQVLLVLTPAGAGGPKHGDFGSETIKVGNATREYRLVAPKTVDLTKPAPLVIAFHGMLIDSKDVMPQYTRLSETAEKRGFLIAYPNAIGKSWGIAPEKVKDDLAFFDALLGRLSATYKIDPDRYRPRRSGQVVSDRHCAREPGQVQKRRIRGEIRRAEQCGPCVGNEGRHQ